MTANGLKRSSAYCIDDPCPAHDQVSVCLKWIDAFAKPTRPFQRNTYSYTLKHTVEDWADTYVTNGAFIMAATIRGYRIQPIDFGPNAFFNMNLCLPEDGWKRVRPIGFSRWLFTQRDRRGWIGALARDAVEDDSWLRREKKFIHFWMYLRSLSAIDGCMDALVGSWTEFSGDVPPVPDSEILMKCDLVYEGKAPVLRLGESFPNALDGNVYIYVLFEDETEKTPVRVKYVGQTMNPAQRLRLHLTQPGTREKLLWIAERLKAGAPLLMGIVDTVNVMEALRLEKAYIYAFDEWERRWGGSLGDGLLNKVL